MKKKKKDGAEYKDMTILYRTNAQSRVLEEKLLAANIPYKNLWRDAILST